MILKRLELHNFIAWRAPPPLSFEGIALACLTGENGAGKSSLLDAITWALWGKARAKRDEDLIHLGQREMRVSLDFEQADRRYRVMRRRARSGKGSRGALDLFVFGEAGPRPISEDGMRRTQDKINAILRLDYETFAHSAFLRQGRADAFALKTPAERKAILADILRLNRWSEYEAHVKSELRQCAEQIVILEHDLRRLDDEIAAEPQLQADLAEIESACHESEAALAQATKAHERVADAARDLRHERENQARQERALAQRQAGIATVQRELDRLESQVLDYEAQIAEAPAIEAGYEQLRAARQNQSAMAERLAQAAALDESRHRLESELAGTRAALQRDRDVASERIAALQKLIDAAAEADLDGQQAQLQQLQKLAVLRDQATKKLGRLQERRSGLRAQLNALAVDGKALNDRLARLQSADGETCPLCGQPLTQAHRDAMTSDLADERDSLRQRYRQQSADINRIKGEAQQRQDEIDGWAQQLKHLPALQQKQGALMAQRNRALDAAAEVERERVKLDAIEAKLKDERFGVEIRRQLDELTEERNRLDGDGESQANQMAGLGRLDAFDQRQRQLEAARNHLPEARETRDRCRAQLSSLQESLANDQAELEGIADAIATLEEKARQELQLRAELDEMRLQAGALREARAIARQELKAIAADRESQKRLRQRLETAQGDGRDLEALRRAFGRDGVPALIIDSALPALETEANALLHRLSGGGLSLRFESQRETVAGKLVETLDIIIADALGSRDYALYSGGEAFRINFAIRIALSRLLARRAGAELRTLFIDEGFGSQDAEGRRKLMEAISVIRSDFEQILVITHIDELRDAFPTQLLVEKTDDGSQARWIQ